MPRRRATERGSLAHFLHVTCIHLPRHRANATPCDRVATERRLHLPSPTQERKRSKSGPHALSHPLYRGAPTRAMAATGVDAAAVEEFLFRSGLDIEELRVLITSNTLSRLLTSADEFQLLRRTLHIVGARPRGVASLAEFRQSLQTMRERRRRHIARHWGNFAAALSTVPALRGRERLARLIISFLLPQAPTPRAATVCLCLAHGCNQRSLGIESFVQHIRTAHTALQDSSNPLALHSVA